MVKKLLKYEFIYYARTFAMFLPIVLLAGLMVRIFSFFDSDNIINKIMLFFSYSVFVMACVGIMLFSTILIIVRFYKNMYSSEGYLTFMLPVTNTQHIFVKLLAATVCQAVSFLTVILSVVIAFCGHVLVDLIRFIIHEIDAIMVVIGNGHTIAFMIEGIIYLLLYLASGVLLYYACITVGQTAKKNKILMSVGAYFVYYCVSQIISSILSVVITAVGMTAVFSTVFEWLEKHPYLTTHTIAWILIIIYAAIAALFWFVTQWIMTKKLNLE